LQIVSAASVAVIYSDRMETARAFVKFFCFFRFFVAVQKANHLAATQISYAISALYHPRTNQLFLINPTARRQRPLKPAIAEPPLYPWMDLSFFSAR